MADAIPVLVVQSKVRELAASWGFRMGQDFVEALNKTIHDLIEAATNACEARGAKTLKTGDLPQLSLFAEEAPQTPPAPQVAGT